MKTKGHRFNSPEEARHFDRHSARNAAIVNSAFEACECQAYESVFTLKRWNAQGFRVKAGEKAIRVRCYRPIREKDPATGEEKITGRAPWTAFLFCSHQVNRPD